MSQELVKILHKAVRALKVKDRNNIIVGVVGYPNTGKSSLANFLAHANATIVGAEPGTTKTTIEVEVDKKITILDCPGVIPKAETNSDNKAGMILRHAVKLDDEQTDPLPPVLELLAKVEMNDILKTYHLAQYKTPEEMLNQLVKKKQALRKDPVSI